MGEVASDFLLQNTVFCIVSSPTIIPFCLFKYYVTPYKSNTHVPQTNGCPAGTIGTQLELISKSECSSCPKGKYCEGTGEEIPTGDCNAGLAEIMLYLHIYDI